MINKKTWCYHQADYFKGKPRDGTPKNNLINIIHYIT